MKDGSVDPAEEVEAAKRMRSVCKRVVTWSEFLGYLTTHVTFEAV